MKLRGAILRVLILLGLSASAPANVFWLQSVTASSVSGGGTQLIFPFTTGATQGQHLVLHWDSFVVTVTSAQWGGRTFNMFGSSTNGTTNYTTSIGVLTNVSPNVSSNITITGSATFSTTGVFATLSAYGGASQTASPFATPVFFSSNSANTGIQGGVTATTTGSAVLANYFFANNGGITYTTSVNTRIKYGPLGNNNS